MQSLPIDVLLPPIVEALKRERRLVLQAPPGTGKLTRVPPALLDAMGAKQMLLVAEPRRIAARLLANRVASEWGQAVGDRVGYRVRFEDMCGPNTRLVYLTSGVLLRSLLGDPTLTNVGGVVIDEFHERHLDSDLALALALRAQKSSRPDLFVVVMSATIQGKRVQEMMGGCPFIRSEAANHPVTIEFASQSDERPLANQVLSAVKGLLREGPRGGILVFLPGALEIRRAHEALATVATEFDIDVLPLHGDMPLGMQASVLEHTGRNKVVLATNVAESSITVPGIMGVVDSGLARTTFCSPWSGLPSLEIRKISRSSAAQRAGRAGRQASGKVTRLFTRADFQLRPEFDGPEILRLDLCEAVLMIRGAGIRDLRDLELTDCPPQTQLQAAEKLLRALGAMSMDGELTELGRQMLQLPVHPRLARLVVESVKRGDAAGGCLAAALLSERDLRIDAGRTLLATRDGLTFTRGTATSLNCRRASNSRNRSISGRSPVIENALMRGLHAPSPTCNNSCCESFAGSQVDRITGSPNEFDLAKSMLLAFPDRVAWRREPSRRELVMTNGNTAELCDRSVVRDAAYLVALVADERSVRGRKGSTIIRLASRIDSNWLLELLAKDVTIEERSIWLDPPGRVETVSTIRYGAVILDESRSVASAGPAVSQLLLTTAESRGVLIDDAVCSLKERTNLLAKCGLLPESERLTDATVRDGLEQMCLSRTDLTGLDGKALASHLKATFPASILRMLNDCAPESFRLAGGRSVVVHYEAGREPWIASRLQDFFGMTETPRICRGQQALTLHLLAPNQRAVQVTQDLSGFWARHYPSIRRELMRRYPKHFWPEDGRNAVPRHGNRA